MPLALGAKAPPDFLKLLAHDVRWRLLWLLARSDHHGKELARLLELPQNLVSYHLQQLIRHGLVRERTSSADERVHYYSVNLEQVSQAYWRTGEQLHPLLHWGNHAAAGIKAADTGSFGLRSDRLVRVLVLCTHNSARSQLAEGWLRQLSHGRVRPVSAGSQPQAVHPLAVRAGALLGLDISHQRSRSLEEVLAEEAGQPFAYVITVCDRMREQCPAFPSATQVLHWSIPDPLEVAGSEEERLAVFLTVAQELRQRVQAFLLLVTAQEHQPEAASS
ncbi:MAG: helix-turn-helix domain-containing protein [Thermogemmatispora sp.]|uniref:arsenate reductase/protein-tyrosine-phosphatase family protein n=1 Tax=Thermogemmatispora sp. TaxID=1968838 RepID=UPI00262E3C3E|nr:helix-turn-helix domain-containing protein [Thermogemmatispora sp.]MBX5458427.1 helix-turn-helix domain-containing protein [Thermogemmatispora sp.]